MMQGNIEQNGQCECGKTTFVIRGRPLLRIFCHCTICQEFNQAAYADVTIFFSKDVQLYDRSQVAFKKYKSPPAVDRGKCLACEKPAIEFSELPVVPSLTIIPSANIPAGECLPEPAAHIYYHRRVRDVADQYQKYSGVFKSQMFLNRKLLPNMLRGMIGAN